MDSVRLSDLAEVFRTTPASHLIRFFNRQAEWAATGTAPPIKRAVNRVQFDTSETEAMVRAVLPHYRKALLDLGIHETAVSEYLSRYDGATSIPPIESVIEDFYSEKREVQPQYSPLDLSTIVPSDALFRCYQGLPVPTGLQKAILSHIVDNLPSAVTEGQALRGILVLATGLGKTYLSIFILERYLATIHGTLRSFAERDKGIILFLVNTTVIREQAFQRFRAYFTARLEAENVPSSTIKKLFVQVDPTSNADSDTLARSFLNSRFIFSLFQSLHIIKSFPDVFTRIYYVIVDEVHHVMAPQYYSNLCLLNGHPKLRLLIGLTATLIHRSDPAANKIKLLFDNNIFVNLAWTEAKRLGFFPKVGYYEYGYLDYQSMVDKLRDGAATIQDFLSAVHKSLDKGVAIDGEAVYRDIVRFIARHGCKRSVLFFGSLSDIDNFCIFARRETSSKWGTVDNLAITTERDICIEFLPAHYRMKKQTLTCTFSRFCTLPRSEHLVLMTVGMATEGFDLQFIDMVALLRRTESERIFVQQLGRGLRKYPDKDTVFVLDYVYGLRSRWARRAADSSIDLEMLRNEITSFWPVRTLKPPSLTCASSEAPISCDSSPTSVLSLE